VCGIRGEFLVTLPILFLAQEEEEEEEEEEGMKGKQSKKTGSFR
jgi:hypothetical protein